MQQFIFLAWGESQIALWIQPMGRIIRVITALMGYLTAVFGQKMSNQKHWHRPIEYFQSDRKGSRKGSPEKVPERQPPIVN